MAAPAPRSSRSSSLFALTAVLAACAGLGWFASAEPPAREPQPGEFAFHHDHVIGTSLDLHVVAPDEEPLQGDKDLAN